MMPSMNKNLSISLSLTTLLSITFSVILSMGYKKLKSLDGRSSKRSIAGTIATQKDAVIAKLTSELRLSSLWSMTSSTMYVFPLESLFSYQKIGIKQKKATSTPMAKDMLPRGGGIISHFIQIVSLITLFFIEFLRIAVTGTIFMSTSCFHGEKLAGIEHYCGKVSTEINRLRRRLVDENGPSSD